MHQSISPEELIGKLRAMAARWRNLVLDEPRPIANAGPEEANWDVSARPTSNPSMPSLTSVMDEIEALRAEFPKVAWPA